jgi:hypothetical protein
MCWDYRYEPPHLASFEYFKYQLIHHPTVKFIFLNVRRVGGRGSSVTVFHVEAEGGSPSSPCPAQPVDGHLTEAQSTQQSFLEL